MKQAEDTEKGLFAIDPDDSGENTLRYGRMKYDGKRGHYTPDCVLTITDFVSYFTKSEAQKAARRIGAPQTHVEKIGTRFGSAWGIRHDFRDKYFLATYC
jgi:hypothetical protein